MKCPECNAKLLPRRARGVELDSCRACGGTWFDAGELEAYRSSAGARADAAGPRFVAAPGRDPAPCPKCVTPTLIGGRAGRLAFRRCSRCAGIYVSERELASLFRASGRH